jgi:hypothetical protein
MDKETVVYIHNGMLFSHKEERNQTVFIKMDGSGDHQVKQNKPEPEKQKSRFLSYVEI